MDKAETRELALELWHMLQDVCESTEAAYLTATACIGCFKDDCVLDIEDVGLNADTLRMELATQLQRSCFEPASRLGDELMLLGGSKGLSLAEGQVGNDAA